MGSRTNGNGSFGFEANNTFHAFSIFQLPMLNPLEEKTTHAICPKGAMPTSQQITTSSSGKKKTFQRSKVGRRGDPRMHVAVNARLANPHMTLLDALLEGGFSFPNMDLPGLSDRAVFDKDGVSLCQRKNQLMRRLRTSKNGNPPKTSSDINCTIDSATGSTGMPKNTVESARKTEPTSNQIAKKLNLSSLEHSFDASSALLATLARQMQHDCTNQQATNIPIYLQATTEHTQDAIVASSAIADASNGHYILPDDVAHEAAHMAKSNSMFSGGIDRTILHVESAGSQPETTPSQDHLPMQAGKRLITCSSRKLHVRVESVDPACEQNSDLANSTEEMSLEEYVEFLQQSRG